MPVSRPGREPTANASIEADRLRPYLPRLVTHRPAETPHQRINGSLTFVDVSGFTKMSERLARKGKVGAEEVADVIGSCFAA